MAPQSPITFFNCNCISVLLTTVTTKFCVSYVNYLLAACGTGCAKCVINADGTPGACVQCVARYGLNNGGCNGMCCLCVYKLYTRTECMCHTLPDVPCVYVSLACPANCLACSPDGTVCNLNACDVRYAQKPASSSDASQGCVGK